MSISLYSKYGGVETVSLVVHKFYKKIQASQLLMPGIIIMILIHLPNQLAFHFS
jgi:hypothetical protein